MITAETDVFELCDLRELQSEGVMAFGFRHPIFGAHDIAVFWDGTDVHAIENSCPHQFGDLSAGMVKPGQVICPLHGAIFDLTTGVCLDRYTYDIAPYESDVRNGRVLVHAPGEERL